MSNMIKSIRIMLFILVSLSLAIAGCQEFGIGRSKIVPKAVTLMISSGTTSNFTPCGCHSGKWGGIPRRGTIFEEEKKKIDWPLMYVDTGDVTQGSISDTQKKKDDYIFQSYKVIGYNAVNVGFNELRLGQENLQKYATEDGIPWISCNIYPIGAYPPLPVEESTRPSNEPTTANDAAEPVKTESEGSGSFAPTESTEPVFAPYKIVEPENAPGFKIALLGATVEDALRLNSIKEFSFEPYRTAIPKYVNQLRTKEKVDLIVLITDSDNLEKVDKEVLNGIDVIFGGNTQPQVSPNAQKNPLNPLYRNTAKSNKNVVNAESGDNSTDENSPAQGDNQNPEMAEVADLAPLPLPMIMPKASGRGRLVTRLDLTLDSAGKIIDYYYKQIEVSDKFVDDPKMAEIARGFDRDVLSGDLTQRIGRNYAGSAACETCHPGFLEAWANGGHFKSYKSVESQNKLEDRECTRCHAIGFVEEPRLLTYDLIDPAHQNVGCEGCHDNGKKHITLKEHIERVSDDQRGNITTQDAMANLITREVCSGCHTPGLDHGSMLNFDVAIEEAGAICKQAASKAKS
ncbi:MAG: multiheme c-type cytochrome [bacterium]